MNKYNIEFIGLKSYIASSLDEARKLALKDISFTHNSLGLSVKSMSDMGSVGEVDVDLANDEQQLKELEEE